MIIVPNLNFFVVLAAIGLYDKRRLMAEEIHIVRTKLLLSAKFESA